MKVIGHRGWPTRYPDNVLEGIAAALEVADMVEVDVRVSGDGHLVLSHDPVLGGLRWQRRLGRSWPKSTWAEASTRPASTNSSSAFRLSPFNLEVKNSPGEPGFDPDHGSALRTAALARPGDLLSCFFWPTMDAVRLEFPDVATGLLVDSDWDRRRGGRPRPRQRAPGDHSPVGTCPEVGAGVPDRRRGRPDRGCLDSQRPVPGR